VRHDAQVTTLGRVREWHDDDGWGVVDSAATPGGCWAHYSSVHVAGYRRLAAGDEVAFSFEQADQDGYSYRTVEVWPAGQSPSRDDLEPPGAGYTSSLTITRRAGRQDDQLPS
jgi:CspA family cold shock protein